ncbi:hypothetical protein MTR_2g093547 [Medicago truncatula]|uniref:Uncharacterized protein n=1 Tax=Medicago truncatula TaxID=3880 RepID=A0A072VMF4_MEDTR|nr:hypothetical protein MTR_2g093547 [Medicago truncatula]
MWEQIEHIQAKNHNTFSKIFCTLFLDKNTHCLQNKKDMKIYIHNQQDIHMISNIFIMHGADSRKNEGKKKKLSPDHKPNVHWIWVHRNRWIDPRSQTLDPMA